MQLELTHDRGHQPLDGGVTVHQLFLLGANLVPAVAQQLYQAADKLRQTVNALLYEGSVKVVADQSKIVDSF